MRISVIVPTYGRGEALERCLDALRGQRRQPDEIIVVTHQDDPTAQEALARQRGLLPQLKVITVSARSQVKALNAGLEQFSGDIVCFTDDDAVPHSDWLEKIEKSFAADPALGGLGGKDNVSLEGKQITGSSRLAGRILWYGRTAGNHHLGCGAPRRADMLKGANMSFRREAVRGVAFDERLRGRAEYRNDMAFCLAVKERGWKLIYDPAIMVDHHYGGRAGDTQRGEFEWATIRDEAHNEFYTILRYVPIYKKIQCLLWQFTIGNISQPGILQLIRLLLLGRESAFRRFRAANSGRLEGIRTWLKI